MLACGLVLLRQYHCDCIIADGHGVVAEDSDVDFGVFPLGEPAVFRFSIENKTCDTLELQSLTTSCGCTEGVCDPKVVPAGASADVTLNVSKRDAAGRFGVSARLAFQRRGDEDLLIVELTGAGEFSPAEKPDQSLVTVN